MSSQKKMVFKRTVESVPASRLRKYLWIVIHNQKQIKDAILADGNMNSWMIVDEAFYLPWNSESAYNGSALSISIQKMHPQIYESSFTFGTHKIKLVDKDLTCEGETYEVSVISKDRMGNVVSNHIIHISEGSYEDWIEDVRSEELDVHSIMDEHSLADSLLELAAILNGS